MAKSLLEQLPEIVANGRKEAERILESIEGRHRVSLQTREWVLPAKDSAAQDWISANARQDAIATHVLPSPAGGESAARGAEPAGGEGLWHNRLIYGDNLLAMAALLAGDEQTPSLRGKVDLIYIDPPFDSKADYRTKVVLPAVIPPFAKGGLGGISAGENPPQSPSFKGGSGSMELEQKPTVIEQFAYSDTWSDGTASYLSMITPRLILMRELLSDSGSIYVHLDWHVGHYVKIVMDEIFGKNLFRNEIIWHYSGWNKQLLTSFEKRHDTLFLYGKSDQQYFQSFFEMWESKEEYVKKRKQ